MNNLKRGKERYKTTIAKELPQQNSKQRGKTAKLIYVAAGIFAFWMHRLSQQQRIGSRLNHHQFVFYRDHLISG